MKHGDKPVNATAHPVVVSGGHTVYGALFTGGMGYRIDKTSGVATGNDPETLYMVTSGKYYNGGCCFDYGACRALGGRAGCVLAVVERAECAREPPSLATRWVQSGCMLTCDACTLSVRASPPPPSALDARLPHPMLPPACTRLHHFSFHAGNAEVDNHGEFRARA